MNRSLRGGRLVRRAEGEVTERLRAAGSGVSWKSAMSFVPALSEFGASWCVEIESRGLTVIQGRVFSVAVAGARGSLLPGE